MMPLRPAVVRHAASATSRVATPRVFARRVGDTPYPFTKSSDASRTSTKDEAPKAAYPFTKSGETTQVPSSTRPVERPGPLHYPGDVIPNEEHADFAPDDYNVQDYRTHAFSPVPQRVQDGSEERNNTAAAVISGAPTELQARRVCIYKPAKTATQSGDWHSHNWKMDWDILQKGHRWENALMGWQSSSDMMQGTKLNFSSKEDAIRFAEKQGYEWFVQEPNERKKVPKAYATQFLHSPGKLKQVRTK